MRVRDLRRIDRLRGEFVVAGVEAESERSGNGTRRWAR